MRISVGLALALVVCTAALCDAEVIGLPFGQRSQDEPMDGLIVPVNPPPLFWAPEERADVYEVQLGRDRQLGGTDTRTVEGIKWCFYLSPRALDEGTWHWRWRPAEGEWSEIRSFEVTASAHSFEVPTPAEIMAGIARGHPRLPKPEGEVRVPRADAEVHYELPEEPIGYQPDEPPGSNPFYARYFAIMRGGGRAEQVVTRAAGAYAVTGDERIGQAARQVLVEVAAWDPRGSTSHKNEDYANWMIMTALSKGYDYLYDLLSEEERAQVRAAIVDRATQIMDHARRRPLEIYPINSHLWVGVMRLMWPGIVLLGEEEEAGDWLEYCLGVFATVWPIWGGTDGGWSRGLSYYRVASFVTNFEMLRKLGINFWHKAFFTHHAEFLAYAATPKRPYPGFGDMAASDPIGTLYPGRGHAQVAAALARELGDPLAAWYAAEMGQSDIGEVEPLAPIGAPLARHFPSVGWVLMHTDLADADNDVFFALKSSPYGSSDHCHSDQNAFVLTAYGQALAVQTGYYDAYGSPHHIGWMSTTRAKNAITVNGGKGQGYKSIEARGEVTEFFHSAGFDYAVGDASEAYLPDQDLSRLTKHPKMADGYGGDIDLWLRHVLFLRPDVFILFDQVHAREPAAFEWWLHAPHEMAVDQARATTTIREASADCKVDLVQPTGLEVRQFQGYDIPVDRSPGLRKSGEDQWHVAFTTPRAAGTQFLSVLQPHRKQGQSRFDSIEDRSNESVCGVALTDTEGGASAEASFRRDREATGPVTGGDLEFDGAAAAAGFAASPGSGAHYFAAGCRELSHERSVLLRADLPVTLAARLAPDELSGTATIQLEKAAEVAFFCGNSRPAVLTLNGQPLAPDAWSWEEGLLKLALDAGEHYLAFGAAEPVGEARVPVTLRVLGESTDATVTTRVSPHENAYVGRGDTRLPEGQYELRVSAPEATEGSFRLKLGATSLRWERAGDSWTSQSVPVPEGNRLLIWQDLTRPLRSVELLCSPDLAAGRPYTLEPDPNYRPDEPGYCTEPGDAVQLTDGVVGGAAYTDRGTVGWTGASPVVTIDLGEARPIAEVVVNAGGGASADVYFPTGIKVDGSLDGETFTPLGQTSEHDLAEEGRYYAHGFKVEARGQARFVRVTLERTKGYYVFIDEIDVYFPIAHDPSKAVLRGQISCPQATTAG